MTIGKNAAYATIATAAEVPVPSHRMASGRMAIAAIGRNVSTSGSTLRSTARTWPIARPSGIAISAATTNPPNTRIRLCRMASGRSPEAIIVMAAVTMRVGTGIRGFCEAVPSSCHAASSSAGSTRPSP